MLGRKRLILVLAVAVLAALFYLGGESQAQQQPYAQEQPGAPVSPYPASPAPGGGAPTYPQSPYGGGAPQPTYPAQPGGGYPQQPAQTPQQPQAQVAQGQVFTDALGRFRLTLPQGAQPFSATYSFAVPQAVVQLNIQSMAQPQMLQMAMQNLPQMVQGMGGQIQGQKQITIGGRQATHVVVTMKDPQSGGQMLQNNVFIPANGLWVQGTSPMQAGQANDQIMNLVLGSLQTQ